MPQPFSFGAGLSGGAQASVAPQHPTQPAGQPDFLALFLQALQAHQQQQGQLGQGRLGLQQDQTFGRHLNAGGQPITGNQDPFSNGMFTPAAERLKTMEGYGSAVGIPPRTDAATNPYVFGPLGPARPDAPGIPGGPFAPSTRAIPGGFEGMVNPAAPEATKYSDSNMFTARPQPTTFGGPQPAKKKTTRPGSSFSFGAGSR